ncbi:MAG: toll/interleukin-1 receptor domain-containing protein [Anaerolineales bacterium]|nr:toll/interleukin-1 receptor domain-containing protein [Anaerolineales bacterium]
MALFSKPELERVAKFRYSYSVKSESDILLLEDVLFKAKSGDNFDIFLSHRYLDSEYVLGLKTELENFKCSVFIDWIEEPAYNRSQVSRETAEWLRYMIKKCRCLLYAISINSPESKWMPWELGYGDGIHGRVAIVPISDQVTISEYYKGQEYLGLYPYVTKALSRANNDQLWVNETENKYVNFSAWLKGENPTEHMV